METAMPPPPPHDVTASASPKLKRDDVITPMTSQSSQQRHNASLTTPSKRSKKRSFVESPQLRKTPGQIFLRASQTPTSQKLSAPPKKVDPQLQQIPSNTAASRRKLEDK